MNTKPLTLDEVSKLLDDLPTEQAMNDERIQSFISVVEDSGKEILRQKEDVGRYIENAAQFLCATATAECLNSSDPKDTLIATIMMKNSEIFTLIFGYAFIYAVGLCATEELR